GPTAKSRPPGPAPDRFVVVPRRGLEPLQPCGHQPLKLARLPIPPPRLGHRARAVGPCEARGMISPRDDLRQAATSDRQRRATTPRSVRARPARLSSLAGPNAAAAAASTGARA